MPALVRPCGDFTVPARQEMALRALSSVVENTGTVVTPFVDFPSLLPDLLATLAIAPGAAAVAGAAGASDIGATAVAAAEAIAGPDGQLSGHLATLQHATWRLRREALRALGIVGALDPTRLEMIRAAMTAAKAEAAAASHAALAAAFSAARGGGTNSLVV